MNIPIQFLNPFRPGAGHMPPYLAGRDHEQEEFKKLLVQDVILDNLVLTGLRGTGKTVLLETLRPLAMQYKWLWVGTDLSETASLSEEALAIRLLTDLSVVTSSIVINTGVVQEMGFTGKEHTVPVTLNYQFLAHLYEQTPGLIADKLKHILEFVWQHIPSHGFTGIIFAYDEAQNLDDHAKKEQYPLSMLLDIFQSIQRKNVRFMLALTGLPTLFPKLVEARTYAERMFHVLTLEQLNEQDSRDAILKPTEDVSCPVKFDEPSTSTIVQISGGYPYFVQFICREVFDIFIQQLGAGEHASVPVEEIVRKLDTDFFAGRWNKATDRQRELLGVIARLDNCDDEFAVQEVVDTSKEVLEKSFSNSHVNQMLTSLSKHGLIYKNRHGRYSFAVPLLGQYIRRILNIDSSLIPND